MANSRLGTQRLELRPLPAGAAAALPADREKAAGLLHAALHPDWPLADLLDVLPIQASSPPEVERFGVWVIIERASATVVGDIGFFGAPDGGGVLEVGYSVVTDRRRRGYATEAAIALVTWALAQPGVRTVVATCDVDNVASMSKKCQPAVTRSSRRPSSLSVLFLAGVTT